MLSPTNNSENKGKTTLIIIIIFIIIIIIIKYKVTSHKLGSLRCYHSRFLPHFIWTKWEHHC